MNIPKIVGIANLTPDSFSDGGHYVNAKEALIHIKKLITDGADIVDIGAESTRPHATPLTPREEWERLQPIIGDAVKIAKDLGSEISVDTRHADNASRSLDAEVSWINDVNGLKDSKMLRAVAASNCKLMVMHSLIIPATPALTMPENCDIISEMQKYIMETSARLSAEGISPKRVVFDPGIGFGKTPAQSLRLITHAAELVKTNLPILFGHSRKSVLRFFTQSTPALRDDVTLACSWFLAAQNVAYLRVHEVRRHREMFLGNIL